MSSPRAKTAEPADPAREGTSVFSAADERWMRRALELADRGRYTTRPNPRVGCVIVRDGEKVAEGWTAPAGGLHAEAHALREAGDAARGATVYCTLEPCSHFGRTPPCADAIVAAAPARVVVAAGDPNEVVDGAGFAKLRAAGIRLDTGLLESEARALNPGFHARQERGRPWTRLKLAASVDGRTAMASGESKWITGPAARRDVHRLRARSCAVVTGVGTILADDARLTARREELEGVDAFSLDFLERAPALRVVLDAALRTPTDARVLTGGGALIATSEGAAAARGAGYGARTQVLALPTEDGRVDLAVLLDHLAARECNEVLLECGPTLAGDALARGLVDELWLYQAPVLLGDRARPLVHLGLDTMAERYALRLEDVARVGDDLRLILRSASAESGLADADTAGGSSA